MSENVGKTQEKCQKQCVGKNFRFRTFCGPWLTMSCEKRSPCFDYFTNVSFLFFPCCVRHVLSLFFLFFSVAFSCVLPQKHNTAHNRQRKTHKIHAQTHADTHTCRHNHTQHNNVSPCEWFEQEQHPKKWLTLPEKGKLKGWQDEQKSLFFSMKNARSYPEKHCFTE